MSWLALSLVPPALFAVSNYLDKYLLERYFHASGNGALIVFSSLVGFAVLPVIALAVPSVLELSPALATFATVNGMLYVAALLPYFDAMRGDDASVAAPLFQLIPVFGYALGFTFLGENLSIGQLLGAALIVAGGIVLAVDPTGERVRVRWRTLGLMAASSALMALNGVLFKVAALESSYWATSFWGYLGLGLMGVGFLALSGSARAEFREVLAANSTGALALNAVNEGVNLAGMLVLNYALLLAPVTYVFLAGATQPLFVLAYGTLLTLLMPKLVREKLTAQVLRYKLAAVLLLGVGAYLIDALAR